MYQVDELGEVELYPKFTEMQDAFPGVRATRERSEGPRAGCPQPNLLTPTILFDEVSNGV